MVFNYYNLNNLYKKMNLKNEMENRIWKKIYGKNRTDLKDPWNVYI